MKVILIKNVDKLGKVDDIVDVADGYARNFLFTQNLAIVASEGSLRVLDEKRKQNEKKNTELAKNAKEVSKKLGTAIIKLNAKSGDDGKLFGSITETQISEEVERLYEYKIDPKDIEFNESIKKIGNYSAVLRLAKGVTATVKIIVSKAS